MGLWRRFSEWREGRKLAALQISDGLWEQALGDWDVYRRYASDDRACLHETALRLLLRKHLVAVDGLEITDVMRLRIAGMAAVPVLKLGLDWYDRWQTLIVYDGPFITEHVWQDENGIVHAERGERSGEAWDRGPVVLSLADVQAAGRMDGYNVVLHELAHTLDMRADGANGAPPLHRGMDAQAWARDMSAAWDDLARRVDNGLPIPIDDYGLEDPAEFFAVLTEAFFETPETLSDCWPLVYRHLACFYRQNPLGD